ncbi:MAG TPA: PHP domain-containing protein [Acidimicrobiales bacterium]|nr:PHP domain-containing protein [Acidimicrobiales bacterium]
MGPGTPLTRRPRTRPRSALHREGGAGRDRPGTCIESSKVQPVGRPAGRRPRCYPPGPRPSRRCPDRTPELIDLHTHSDRSDGSDPPERIPELAAEVGCRAVALTDHDRLDGIERAQARGRELGVRVVAGCELSCTTPWGSAHVLAYFVEDRPGALQDELVRLREWRAERNRHLVDRLAGLGLPVTIDEVEAEAGAEGAGRPHVAAVLVRKGVVSSVQEAFDEWLAKGRPGYVERRRIELSAAIGLVRASKGVAVLAHPLSLGLEAPELDAAVAEMAAHGLGGIEAIYGRYRPEVREGLASLAHRHGLAVTGGSDHHGIYKPDLRVGVGQGDLRVPDELLDALEARRP